MSTHPLGYRTRPRKTPMQTRLVGGAFGRPAGSGSVVREAQPGMGIEATQSRGEAVRSGTVSALLHGALLGLLLWLAWMTPAIREEILPVQLIKEEPPPPVAKREEPKPEPVPEPVV